MGEFWRDAQGRKRDFRLNIYLKFQQEDWEKSNCPGDGEWQQYIYRKLPRGWEKGRPVLGNTELAPDGLDVEMPLMHNSATASGTMMVNGRLVGDRCNGEPGAS